MIEANHQKWAHTLFRFWLYRGLLQDFSAIYCTNPIPPIPNGTPLILTPNHTTWYDGFIPYFLNLQYWKRTYHILMLEDQLRRYPFFRKLGAVGMQPGNGADVRQTLRYLSQQVRPDSLLVYFPEGRLLPDTGQPYHLNEGLKFLQVPAETLILPMRMRMESLNERKPAMLLSFGEPIPHPGYQSNPDLLNTAFNELRARENIRLSIPELGTCIWGKPHVGL